MDRPTPQREHRNDLQGLRAIAVILVALSHARVPGFSGGFVGVDVFFVLSGYLITGLLLREAADGLAGIGEFYKRRARRILPAATLTLVTTVIAGYLLLNYVRARALLNDAIWTAFFAANIHFAQSGTDYFASAQPPSALQHFWTLAVEEQFYVVWPALLLAVLTLVIRHRKLRSSRHHVDERLPALLTIAGVITVASLALSISQDGSTSSYFSTFSRAWELGLGATLAIIVARRRLRVPPVAGWAGLAAIIAAAAAYSSSTPFPGYAALLPTLGTVLVIAAGLPVLAISPLRYVGDRSYTLYLWHWPFLILAEEHAGHRLSVGVNLLLLAAAFGLSIITYRFYENPLRHREWSGAASAFAFTASVGLVTLIASVGISSIDNNHPPASAAVAQPAPLPVPAAGEVTKIANEGVQALPAVATAVDQAQKGAPLPAGLSPSPSQLLDSEYRFPQGCAAGDGSTSSRVCTLGRTDASRTLVVFGDSHAEMWMPAILAVAQRDGWKVIPFSKSACRPAEWTGYGGDSECVTWYRWATGQAANLRPYAALIAGDYAGHSGAQGAADLNGIGSTVTTLQKTARHVVVVGDVPPVTQQPVDCLLAHGATMGTCAATWTSSNDTETAAIADDVMARGGGYIDTDPWFCDGTVCPLVVGGVVTHLDQTHVTDVYALKLENVFRAAFNSALKTG